MNLNHQQLINLPVYTQSDDYLGRVSGFDFNTDSHTISKYYIKQSSFVKNLLGSLNHTYDLVIASAQVVEINEEKMIVENNIAKDLESAQEKIKNSATIPASLARMD